MLEIVYTSILEIKVLSNQYKVSSGKPLNWIISSIQCIELSILLKNREENLQNSQKGSKCFLSVQKFSKYLKNFLISRKLRNFSKNIPILIFGMAAVTPFSGLFFSRLI